VASCCVTAVTSGRCVDVRRRLLCEVRPDPLLLLGAVARYIEELREIGALKGVDIANITEVSKATVSRWANGAASPHPRTQLVLSDLRYIAGRLDEYYSADEIRTWLYARHPQLDGLSALDADTDRYGALSYAERDQKYPRPQEIAETAHFVGFDGLLVPSARLECLNVILFCDRIPADTTHVVQNHGAIRWNEWRKQLLGY